MTTATATTSRVIRSDYLKLGILGTALSGLDTTSNTSIQAEDSILIAIGKAQAQIDNLTASSGGTVLNGSGFVKMTGTSVSYDPTDYVPANVAISANTTGALVKYDTKGLVTSSIAQSQTPASTNGYLLTASGTAGSYGTPVNSSTW